MTSGEGWKFGWKRKIGAKVSKDKSVAFENETKDEEVVSDGEVDWLTLAPKRQVISLEDTVSKAQRLKKEGVVLAEAERYWEAVRKWNEALQLTPDDEKLYEMKAQSLLILCEVFPAAQAAAKAIELSPTWWVAYQTLGRVHLGMGEVTLAVKNFSKAVHINPCDRDLWEDDLLWAYSLLQKRKLSELEKERLEKQHEDSKKGSLHIKEIQGESSTSNSVVDVYKSKLTSERNLLETDSEVDNLPLNNLPRNYIRMRDK